MMIVVTIITAVVMLGAGYVLNSVAQKSKLKTARKTANDVVVDAKKEAENLRKEAELEVKDEIYKARIDFERESKERRSELIVLEKRVLQKEENLERKVDYIDKKEVNLGNRETDLKTSESRISEKTRQLDSIIEEERQNLQKISGLSRDQAREILLKKLEEEVRHDSAAMIRQIESEAKETAEKKANEIISLAIQRFAGDHVSESTVTTVALPTDEIKGKIIGREGRNIRALEAATGIDVIIDDTPEAVILSGFDPIRREIARITLERLIVDGRIHPARIEEVAEKVKKEMEEIIREAGEQTIFDVGLHGVHPEIIRLLGRLKYRTSYGQNVLNHSKEVAYVMGIMAAELDLDIQLAKRVGLFHDVGKAVDHEVEGSHAVIGADILKKHGETPEVIHAVRSHHNEDEPQSIYAVLIQAADTLSAARPGARSETLEAYIKRLEKLEEIANGFNGVEKAYAIQAGREVRVIVQPEKIDDADTFHIARNIANKVQEELDYPGQIKVMVVRETRAVEFAK